ncbi:MAG: hypothetical protein JO040_06195 [Gemmatimonadetes bacterium]|nr:hypothetical protein [Gemmatimonadota bacterium]
MSEILPAHSCAVCGTFTWCEMVPVQVHARHEAGRLRMPVCEPCARALHDNPMDGATAGGVAQGFLHVWDQLDPAGRLALLRLIQLARHGGPEQEELPFHLADPPPPD